MPSSRTHQALHRARRLLEAIARHGHTEGTQSSLKSALELAWNDAEQAPTFAIGDVHGCADELDELLNKLPLQPGCTIVFLGDLIDRGPKSRQIVERVLALRAEHRVIALLGNHEAMLLEYLEGTDAHRIARFLLSGGTATLASYSEAEGKYQIPAEHLAFFRALPLWHATDDHFFVHAGVPEIDLAELDAARDAEEMLWTRKTFLESRYRWDKLIVHGHSPTPAIEIAENRISLDTGCVFGGALTAMEFPSMRTYSVRLRTDAKRRFLSDGSQRAAIRFRGTIPVSLSREGREPQAEFVTVDYSEVGIAIRAQDPRRAPILTVGDRVSGFIGPAALFRIAFEGDVVRTWEADGDKLSGLHVELATPEE